MGLFAEPAERRAVVNNSSLHCDWRAGLACLWPERWQKPL
jgi:hypothetical protein